ncbi:MAG TPA: hypothetical protein VH561_10985 [Micromonosporaceae bacterium]|jgi:hypothetical protein
MGHTGFGDGQMPAVFPDWSPYADLESATRAYLRDPDLALDALAGVLPDGDVVAFTLERFVSESNCVWQEVAVCDGSRLILWHGEDLAPGDGPSGSMTSSIRVVPLSQVTEVGTRRRLQRAPDGTPRVDAVDVYVLLGSLDDGGDGADDYTSTQLRQDALRFVKTIEDGGPGQISRLEEFARTVSALIGRPF